MVCKTFRLVLPLLLPPQQDNPDEALDGVFGPDTAGVRCVPCHWELVGLPAESGFLTQGEFAGLGTVRRTQHHVRYEE